MRSTDKKNKKHPYARRTWLRSHLPWFIINLGIASKGRDCEIKNAEHHWYKKDEKSNACYHCKIVKHLSIRTEEKIPLSKKQNSLFSNLRFIVQNLVFEEQNELLGKVIKIDRASQTIDRDIQFAVNQICNFETTLKKTEQRKLAISKYGILDLEFELRNFKGHHSAFPIKVLRNEQILQKDEFKDQEEREEAREMMSLMLKDDIQSMKDTKLYLKIFAEAKNGFISQHDLFQKGESKKTIKNPQNPNIVEFEIIDACITNLSGIWFNKHFYW